MMRSEGIGLLRSRIFDEMEEGRKIFQLQEDTKDMEKKKRVEH